MRGAKKKKRAAEDTFLEGASSKKAAAPASTPGHAHAGGREPDDAPPTTTELQEAPPQGVSWSYHHTQIDAPNKFQRMSSEIVRGNFLELLLGDRGAYRVQFAIVSRMNPAIAGAIRDHTVSQANMPRYERARSLFGYQDDSGASDTEEEAAVAGAEGFARFGREPRCDVRWAEPLSQLRVHHVDDAEMVQHAQPLLHTLLVLVHPLSDGREQDRAGTFAQFAYRLLQGEHTRFDAAGRATHHAAPVERNVLLIGVLRK